MDPKFRDNYYAARRASDVFKSVNTTYTSTTLASLWTPASGKKFRLKGANLRCVVTTTLGSTGSEAVGNQLVICDSVVTSPIAMIGALSIVDPIAGSTYPGIQLTVAAVTTATALLIDSSRPIELNLNEGFLSSAADNVLKFGVSTGAAAVDIGSGVIRIVGSVWGTEE